MTASNFSNQNVPFATSNDPNVYPQFIVAKRAPTSQDIYPAGTRWQDTSVTPKLIYETQGGGDWDTGGVQPATTTTYGTVLLTDNNQPVATKVYADNLVASGAPIATTTTAGISQLATDAKVTNPDDGGSTLADPPNVVRPSNLVAKMSSPGTIGDTAPGNATFKALTADGTAAVSLGANDDSDFTVTGAGKNLTLKSSLGSVYLEATEAAADAIKLTATTALGGIDINAGTGGMTLDSGGELSIDSAGTTNLTATGAFDVTVKSTAGSVIINGEEAVSDAIQLTTNSAGGITSSIGSAGYTATNTGKYTFTSSTNAAQAFYLHADGGTSETIQLHADQGTAATSVYLLSDAGGITLTATGSTATNAIDINAAAGGVDIDGELEVNIASAQAAATAINLVASDDAGGVTIHAGTGGIFIGNQSDVDTIDIADVAPDASRTITIGGGTVVAASTTDTIDIGPDGATTNADSVKTVNVNTGGVTTGQVLTNVATGAITSGTHTVEIQTGNAAAGTVATNLSTGTGTKTVNIGNADANTTVNIDAVTNINDSINANTKINSGTSNGTVTVGNSAAQAITVDTGAGISLDAATESNFTVTGASEDLLLKSAGGSVKIDATENAAGAIALTTNGGTSETLTLTNSQGTDAASINLSSTAGGITLTSNLANPNGINLNAVGGGVDIDGALEVNIASSQAAATAVNIVASNASGGITINGSAGVGITHTGACIFTPDAITSDNAGVAASVSTFLTQITTDGDSNEDNVTLADGVDGQIKMFAVVAAGNAADSVKITPANMAGGSKITFAADPTGLGCTMAFDGTNWTVVANNGGTIA